MSRRGTPLLAAAALSVFVAATLAAGAARAAAPCAYTVTADVVVFDTPIMFNRLGAQNPNWITYALKRDVVALRPGTSPGPGNAQMRKDKRVRPLVLRVNEGDCLQVNFENWLAKEANPFVAADREPPMNDASPFLDIDDQVKGRYAGFHVRGLHLADSDSFASFVGKNPNGLVRPGGSATYRYYAPPNTRGTYLADSYGATFGGEASAGNTGQGMFAAVNVEPKGARWYRSQVTEEEMRLATTGFTGHDQPVIDYETSYPNVEPWISEGKAGLPILNMRDGNRIVHSDLNAIIAGPDPDGTWNSKCPGPSCPFPLEKVGRQNPSVPNRLEPFREFTVIFHDENSVGQAFPGFFDADPVTARLLHGVRDTFMINYGSGGVGAEVIANRLGVGPMWDCLSCAYEEFFLTSFAVGDPAMLVDVPANVGLEQCLELTDPDVVSDCPPAARGPKANKAFFPDDPSNVHHSYQNDRVVFRNLHAGKEHHIFHLHNHQWLFDVKDDNSNYIDAQAIGPGSAYTYEINFGGAGNRNKSAGDAIFHCHFYPHFAQGMWGHWRIHDVFEAGTPLDVSVIAIHDPEDTEAPGKKEIGFHTQPFALFDGTPAEHPEAGAEGSGIPTGASVRSLPDGEILVGTPIPAVVPLPGKAMPPMPGEVVVVQKSANGDEHDDSSQAFVVRTDLDAEGKLKNPGYPFWIAGVDCGADPWTCEQGIVGQRPPTPALDMLSETQAMNLRSDSLFKDLNNLGPIAGNQAFRNGGWDGGLPRHALDGFRAVGGRTDNVFFQEQTKFSFYKEILKAKPVWFPEEGTDLEQVAMAFHAQREHQSTALRLGEGPVAATYITNGAPPQAGSPFFEPCVDDQGKALFTGTAGRWFGSFPGDLVDLGTSPFNATTPRVYKGANIQIDAVFNKKGYHYPQQRIISLWEDVMPYINKQKPPEVFAIRNNTLDCTRYLHTNLAPHRFDVDDYEVTTPTDVIGQHIHLPKWDLPSADGSGNGWNYEDGTFSPGTVQERIHAISHYQDPAYGGPGYAGNPANSSGSGANEKLKALAHPFFGKGQQIPNGHGGFIYEYLGARTTIQRWMFDPVLNIHHVDRGLGIIFTHDHFGPSTVQQVGLYASVLTEPIGSRWVHNETGAAMYTRPDGGPTSWQAAILPGGTALASNPAQFEPFREFWFQHSDFQHAYEAGVYVGAGPDGRPLPRTADGTPSTLNSGNPNWDGTAANAFRFAINPPVREFTNPVFPDVIENPADCKDGTWRPCPEAISADDPGFLVTNYRNEPIGWRVFDPNKTGPDGKPGAQADGDAGDLALALQSRADRAVRQFGTRLGDTPYAALTADIGNGDPFTPMMRAYAGDLIRIKSQAGGDEEEHNFSIHGIKWLQGGSSHGRAPNSGWRSAQHRGISEQFSFAAPIVPFIQSAGNRADYAYSHTTSQDGWWSGMWGLLRTYNQNRNDLFRLPTTIVPLNIANPNEFNGVCPTNAPLRTYDITAVTANMVLGNDVWAAIPDNIDPVDNAGGPLDPHGGTLVYNPRNTAVSNGKSGPLHDPTALLYVRTEDLHVVGQGNLTNVQVESECIVQETVLQGDGTETLVFSISGSCPVGDGCFSGSTETGFIFDPNLPACPLKLRAGAPVEPIVLRATAGECVQVTLRNHLPEQAPDLAGYHQLLTVVPRDQGDPGTDEGLTWFGNNLVRPSSIVGITPQLVTVDVTRHDGTVVGQNPPGNQVAMPGGQTTYRWYAGDVRFDRVRQGNRTFARLVATPIEFGGANLMPADKIKQGQKGLIGALVIGPQGAAIDESDTTWDHQQAEQSVTRETRASATFNGTIRDFAVVFQDGINLRYKDGTAVENFGADDEPPGATSKGINYGTEPMWFRFGIAPDRPFGNAETPGTLGAVRNPEKAYSNFLDDGFGNPVGDPATPVFTAMAGAPVRMHILLPSGTSVDDLHNRGFVFHLHGHLWQRAPYVCPGQNDGLGPYMEGKCDWTDFGAANFEPGSRAIGVNPIGMYLGAQESVLPASHFDIVLPGDGIAHGGAGGLGKVPGDYLFRDQASFGNSQGLWGILRVEPEVQQAAAPAPATGGGGGKGKKK
jgi:manganese oxidase